MKVLCVFGEYQYGDAMRGRSLEAACFIPALEAEGHEVRLFDSWMKGRFNSHKELNSALYELVNLWRPDVLLSVVMDVEIWSETLAAIRRLGVRAVSWGADDTWKWRQVSRFVAHDYDGMISTHAGAIAAYQEEGIRHVALSQWAAPDPSFRPPLPAASCTYQVSFIGMAYGDRRRYILALQRAGCEVSCFGHHWPGGSIAHEEIPRIMQKSIISLNFSKGLYGGPNQIKARVFEVPGAGGFLLTEDSPGLAQWYRLGDEIDVFSDSESLVERVRYYLSNPAIRDACTHRAYDRTRHEHTYRIRMRAVMAFAVSLPAVSLGTDDFDQAKRNHRSSWHLSVIKWILTRCCRLIWGEERSAAIARRIAFEVSWRLSGRHTFTAQGWFGRMFI